MIDKRIVFDDRYDNGETTTLYFIAPKEMLYGKYPEAEHMEISIELPNDHMDAAHAVVDFSPTKYFEEDDAYVDYDWYEVELPHDEIEELIALADRSM